MTVFSNHCLQYYWGYSSTLFLILTIILFKISLYFCTWKCILWYVHVCVFICIHGSMFVHRCAWTYVHVNVEASGWYQVTDYTHTLIQFNKIPYYLIVPYIYIKNLNKFHYFPSSSPPSSNCSTIFLKIIPLLFLFLLFVHNPLGLVTASSVCIGGKLFNGSKTVFHWLHHWIKWQISHNNLYLPVYLQGQLRSNGSLLLPSSTVPILYR